VLDILGERTTALLRGLVRTRRPVFLGPGVRLRGKRSIEFGRAVSIGPSCTIDGFAREKVVLEANSRLGSHCVVTTTSHVSRRGTGFRLGARSGLGDFCHVGASGGVTVGNDVIMGSYVSFHAQEHVHDRTDIPIVRQGTTEKGIVVGDGCWVGARVTFLDGSNVGAHSIVAAGAVVKGVFPPYSIIGGVPARLLRDRRVGG
jgi:acetyltransferase-like isoleucine patch superfamily enzyme